MSVFAWADLHGRFDILMEGLQYINPEDTVYFLGDAADRGPDGWECIKYILNDERFIYIKGNHEDLLWKAIGDIKTEHFNANYFHYDQAMSLWFWNGGEVTYDAIMSDDTMCAKKKIETIHKLNKLPFCAMYYNTKGQHVLLSHAGCDNCDTAEQWDEEKFIWDRNHLMFYDSWYGENNEVIVHGHTPIELMIKEQRKNVEWLTTKHMHEGIAGDHLVEPQPWKGTGAYWYAKNHKVNIDTGAVWNNHSVLLNLDTWEEIVITITPQEG